MLNGCPCDLSDKYLAFWALECHYTPQQVDDMPWVSMIRLTFVADALAEQRQKERDAETLRRAQAAQ